MRKNIVISGASSGIGAALAIGYASNNTKIFLAGRKKERLEEIANACKLQGSLVSVDVFDICETDACADWIRKINAEGKIDLLIANAGISGEFKSEVIESVLSIKNVINTNLIGTINIAQLALTEMINNKCGHIAIVSSMIALNPMPICLSYALSKSALVTYANILRKIAKMHNVTVSTILPGYVHTPLTARNKFPMPFIMDANLAAKKIIIGLENKKKVIIFPKIMFFIAFLSKFIPYYLLHKIIFKYKWRKN